MELGQSSLEKIYKKINIIGCGFVGLTTGLGLATKGHSINFIDIDKRKLNKLKKGKINFYEQGLSELLNKINKKRVFFTDNLNDVDKFDITFICVDTPSDSFDGKINLKTLEDVFFKIKKINFKKKHLLVIKSTVIPGTTDMFYKKIKKHKNLYLSNNPEFLREGSALNDFLFPDRIIFGCYEQFSFNLLSLIYKNFKSKIFKFSPVEAEYSKYFSNIYFANLISFANQFSDSLKVNKNVNYKNILESFSYDKRISVSTKNKIYFPNMLSYLIPGPGFGGSCFPKDINAFNYFLEKNHIKNNMIKSILDTNKQRDKEILKIINLMLKGKTNQSILIYGISFKPGSDDLRNSKSVSLYNSLNKNNLKFSKIISIDPFIKDYEIKKKFNIVNKNYIYNKKINLMIIMNNYSEFKKLNFKKIDGNIQNILDLRNVINFNFKKTNIVKLGSH